jgi:hypothetical protein
VTSDPVDSFDILISKEHGFARVFDLFTFPYHLPGQPWRSGLDFMLDMSSKNDLAVNQARGELPSRTNKIFDIVDFVAPTEQELVPWNTGDILESLHQDGLSPLSITNLQRIMDTVVSYTVAGHTATVVLSGTHAACPAMLTCSPVSTATTYLLHDNAYPIGDPGYIPEEGMFPSYIFYYPYDSTLCKHSPAYTVIPRRYHAPASFDFEYERARYKFGVFDDENGADLEDLTYYKIGSNSCGTPIPSLVQAVNPTDISIFPDPASSEMIIDCGQATARQISLTDMLGRSLITLKDPASHTLVNVANIPPGQYVLTIATQNGGRINRKVSVVH